MLFLREMRKTGKVLLLGLWGLCAMNHAMGQYSFLEYGVCKTRFQSGDPFKNNYWTGFTASIAGFYLSRYTGHNNYYRTDTELPDDFRPGGVIWDAGYQLFWPDGILKFKVKNKITPLVLPGLALGVGKYSIDRLQGFSIHLKPSASIQLVKGVSVFGQINSGYNFSKKDPYLNESVFENSNRAVHGFFALPTFGLRLYHNVSDVLDGAVGSREYYHGGGTSTYEWTDAYGVPWSSTITTGPSGVHSDYAVIAATNPINFYVKYMFPTSSNFRYNGMAGGAGMMFRWGAFCVDIEHVQGTIPYFNDDAPDYISRQANHWALNNTSWGFGVNVFNLWLPFKAPSVYRFIIGFRRGFGTLQAIQSQEAIKFHETPPTPIQGKGIRSSFISAEFGRIAITWDYYYSDNKTFRSGAITGASYLIPIGN